MTSLESSDKKIVAVSDSPTPEVAELEAQLSTKERLSAYFTIAAAAFGLISDGCEYNRAELLFLYLNVRVYCRSKQSHDYVQCQLATFECS